MAEARSEVELKPFRQEMTSTVLRLNDAAVPHVSRIDAIELLHLLEQSCSFQVAFAGDEVIGFCLALSHGAVYESPNYRWFHQRYEEFLYVDRIVVAESHHRRGLGRQLYDDLIASNGHGSPVLTCEVNLRPANPISLAFHQRLGFRIVGEQDTDGGTKRVALMLRSL